LASLAAGPPDSIQRLHYNSHLSILSFHVAMDTIIIVMLCLVVIVIAFGVAGMAQMLRLQKPRKGADSDAFPQVR
jgi:hypothetical protein